MRERLGVAGGDEVELEFSISEKPLLDILIPKDLMTALKKDPKAKAEFDRIPPSHKKEYILYINEAKKPETRASRIEKTIKQLTESSDGRQA